MKRGGRIQRKTALRATKGLTRRTKISVAGRSEVSDVKREIQATAREIVILRDGGCILKNLPAELRFRYSVPDCGGWRNDGEMVLQADHLVTRGNAATYADTRLIVCVCKGHHGWKSTGSNLRKKQYDALVRELLPPDRVALWDRCEEDSWRATRKGSYDWQMDLIALKQELKQLTKNHD